VSARRCAARWATAADLRVAPQQEVFGATQRKSENEQRAVDFAHGARGESAVVDQALHARLSDLLRPYEVMNVFAVKPS
jgi:hypothetical protein